MLDRLFALGILIAIYGWGQAEAAVFYRASALATLSLAPGSAGFGPLVLSADPMEISDSDSDGDAVAEVEADVGDGTAEATAAGEAVDGSAESFAFGGDLSLMLENPTDLDVALSFVFTYALFAEVGALGDVLGDAEAAAEATLLVDGVDEPHEFFVSASFDDPLAMADDSVFFNLIVPGGGVREIQFTALAEGAAFAEPSGSIATPVPLPGAAASLVVALAVLVAAGGRGRRDRT